MYNLVTKVWISNTSIRYSKLGGTWTIPVSSIREIMPTSSMIGGLVNIRRSHDPLYSAMTSEYARHRLIFTNNKGGQKINHSDDCFDGLRFNGQLDI